MSARPARKRRAVVEEIEPHILYSADFAPGLADADAFAPEAEQRVVEASGERNQRHRRGGQQRGGERRHRQHGGNHCLGERRGRDQQRHHLHPGQRPGRALRDQCEQRVVTVAGALDREAAASHGIVVRATSTDGNFSTHGFTVSLTDVDEFDVGGVSDADAAADAITENAALGTLVGITASASDGDATTNVITYTLDNSAGGRFTVDSLPGLTVAGALDAETAGSHGIVVRATSADGSFSTQGFTVAVADVNEFGVGPIADANAGADSVAENTAPGTVVGITAVASDADVTTNAITSNLDVDAGGRFAIDANTRVVTVAGALDAEAAASHNRRTSIAGSCASSTTAAASHRAST